MGFTYPTWNMHQQDVHDGGPKMINAVPWSYISDKPETSQRALDLRHHCRKKTSSQKKQHFDKLKGWQLQSINSKKDVTDQSITLKILK